MEKIGIIGGAGVAATNKLLELIEIELTKNGAYRDFHHPEMLIYQATHVPSRSLYLEGKGESFIPGYIEIAKKLKNSGATKLCMCCNTAHFAIDKISEQANIPFINIIEKIAITIKELGIKKIGLIASDGCRKGQVYEKYIERLCPDTKIIYPDKEMQHLVTKGICNIKNNHRFDDINSKERPNYIFRQVNKYLYEQGAQKIIIGCTDIRVDYYDEKTIDSLEVLKNSIINEIQLGGHKESM